MATENTRINTSIWRMSEEARSLEDELINNGGELTPELEERLQVIDEDKEKVVDSISTILTSVKADNDVIAEEIKRLQGLKKVREKTAESLKEALRRFMVNNGVERIETPTHIAKITKGREHIEFSESLEMETYQATIDNLTNALPPYITIKAGISRTELMKWVKDGNPTRSAEILREPSIQIK